MHWRLTGILGGSIVKLGQFQAFYDPRAHLQDVGSEATGNVGAVTDLRHVLPTAVRQ
jgi:hypothetical protein